MSESRVPSPPKAPEVPGNALRARLYAHYVSGGQAHPPETLEGLAPRAPYLRHVLARHLPPERSARILDLGCGYGALLHFAREAGYADVRGIDVSPEQVAAATRLGIDGVEEGDLLESLRAAPAESVDVVTAFDVAEHMHKDELLALVDAVQRVLRPGGRWILHVPNAESPFFGAIRYGDLTHELAFTRGSLATLLAASGFGAVQCYEEPPIPHGAKSVVRWLIWKLVRVGLRVYAAAETGEASGHIFSRNLLAVARK